MESEHSIPGFRELCDWPSAPVRPFRIRDCGGYRDPAPYSSYYVDLVDGEGTLFPLFFERFLGRLCYGRDLHTGEDAAFLEKGSRIQIEAFQAIEDLAPTSNECDQLLKRLERARNYV